MYEIPATCQQHWALTSLRHWRSVVNRAHQFCSGDPVPEFNFQRPMATTSRCMATRTSTSSLETSTCMFVSTSATVSALGVNDLVSSNVELNLRNFHDSYLQQHDHQELLQYIGRHFYIPAILTEANKLNVVWQTIIQQEFFDSNVQYSQPSGILTSDIAL